LTGTPIDRTTLNTHRDFGPVIDGEQERYISYYGIKRAIKDGATLEVHYIRDKVPFNVDEKTLSVGYEEMCQEMELEDEGAKDLIQRKRAQWKELARHPDRVEIVLEKMLKHFLEHPDPSGFKAQLVGVDRTACARFKDALDTKLKARGLPPEWTDVIISEAQNDEQDLARFHYGKQKQDELIDYFKLTPKQWEEFNRERFGEDSSKWRPPLKILIVCDRLLTGFDAPIEQVMYLDKPLRDHSLLQAIARTNRPLPTMDKRTGLVVDYFGVFADLTKALNFDENIREESLIDWEALKATVPGEVARCMASFKGITIADTRDCLLTALRSVAEPEAAQIFEHNFKSLERLWEAISPDPCLYEHRFVYRWLCGIYVAYCRRKKGTAQRGTFGELSNKTRALIEENTTFLEIAQSLPVFKIDKDYVMKLDELPNAADKAAALEAYLDAELAEDEGGFTYQQLGARLARIKARKDAADAAAEQRLKALLEVADEKVKVDAEPTRLNLIQTGEYAMFTVLREFSQNKDEAYLSDCSRIMIGHLRSNSLLQPGWSTTKGGRLQVRNSLLGQIAAGDERFAALGLERSAAAFLDLAVTELVGTDAV